MDNNRRCFLKKMAIGGITIGTGVGESILSPRRIFADNSSGSFKLAYRKLGSTGFKTTEIGFGAMNMRDPELVHAAIDYGINYIDTAHNYMKGVNEEVVGQVMKTKRDKVFLTTKVPKDPPNVMMEKIQTSLKRLQTDRVDLLLLHVTSERGQVLNQDWMKTFEEAKKKGMCRFIGISTHENQAEVLDAAVEGKIWDAVLVGYNYVSPANVKESIKKAREKGLAIIAMKNILNPSVWPWKKIDDIRKDKNGNMSPAQALIKWVLNDPNVDTTIPGISNFEELKEDMVLMSMKMSFDDSDTLRRYGEAVKPNYCQGVAGCTGCVGQCPNGVKVNDINRCLAYAHSYGNYDTAIENYINLPAKNTLAACENCSECQVKCINGLDIKNNLRIAKELFA